MAVRGRCSAGGGIRRWDAQQNVGSVSRIFLQGNVGMMGFALNAIMVRAIAAVFYASFYFVKDITSVS